MPMGLTLRESNYSTGIINIADNMTVIILIFLLKIN